MLLVFGSSSLMLAMLLFGTTLIGARNPLPPAWANDFLVANVYVPVMIALGVLGVASIAKLIISMDGESLSVKELLLAVGIVAVGMALFKGLHIKRRLADLNVATHQEKPIPRQVLSIETDGRDVLVTPVDPTSGNLAA